MKYYLALAMMAGLVGIVHAAKTYLIQGPAHIEIYPPTVSMGEFQNVRCIEVSSGSAIQIKIMEIKR